MDAADAARLTEAVTDAVADAVKRGENYSSLEDFLTDESVERMTEAVIEEAAETLGLADADDSGSKKEKIRDSRVAALKDMAKEIYGKKSDEDETAKATPTPYPDVTLSDISLKLDEINRYLKALCDVWGAKFRT